MSAIQYTSVFRGVVLVQVPVARPKIEVAPLPKPKPPAAQSEKPAVASAGLDTVV